MKYELKIDLLEADFMSMEFDSAIPPDGLTVQGPICTSLHGIDMPTVAPYLLVVVSIAGPVITDALKDVAKERIKNWLADFLARHKATRTRINGKKTETRADVQRVLREEIDITRQD